LYFGSLNQLDVNGKPTGKSTPFRLAPSICHGKVSRQKIKKNKVLQGIFATERLITISKNHIALLLFLPAQHKEKIIINFKISITFA